MRKVVYILLVSLTIASCYNQGESKSEKNELLEFKAENLTDAEAEEFVSKCMTRFKDEPDDSLAPYFLMKAADVQRFVRGKALMAVKKYNQVYNRYPQHELAPVALFMMGVTFDDNLGDHERASQAYFAFIQQFPKHEYREEAENLLSIAQDSSKTLLDQVHQWMKMDSIKKQSHGS